VDLHTGFDYGTWNATLYVRKRREQVRSRVDVPARCDTLYGNYGTQVIDPRTVGLSVTKRF